MPRYTQEIGVSEASTMIGVTTRTIINYIKSKELEATKVGKSWFINKASFDAFCLNKNFKIMEPEERSIPKVQEFLLEKEFSVINLRLFQKATSQLMNIPKVPSRQQALLSPIITEALGLIGAGYYTFGVKAKKEYYNQSRAQVGKLLAVVYSGKNKNLHQWANEIEHELLPAYGALIKKLDSRHEPAEGL